MGQSFEGCNYISLAPILLDSQFLDSSQLCSAAKGKDISLLWRLSIHFWCETGSRWSECTNSRGMLCLYTAAGPQCWGGDLKEVWGGTLTPWLHKSLLNDCLCLEFFFLFKSLQKKKKKKQKHNQNQNQNPTNTNPKTKAEQLPKCSTGNHCLQPSAHTHIQTHY